MERAQLLKEARLRKRLTREGVADRLGVDPTTVTRWENGTSTPQPINLLNLCELYGVTPQELDFEDLSLAEELPIVTQNTMVLNEEDEASPLHPFRKQDLTLCLMRIVWNWPCNHARYQELQMMIMLELEDNSTMDEHIHRRDALRRLALLPIEMCGLSALHSVLKRPSEEILAQCAAGITACWYLRKGKELAFANDAVSQYIPTLKAIVKSSSSVHRKAAADLLVQGLLLKSVLAWNITTVSDAISFAQQAETYSRVAEDSLLQVVALRTQAAAYSYANQWEQALHTAQKAKYFLEKRGKVNDHAIPHIVQSYVYAGLATYQAYNGQKHDALTALSKAHKTFFVQSPDEQIPIWIDHSIGNLLTNDGQTHTSLGLYGRAIDSLEQIHAYYADDQTIPMSCRIASFIDQVVAEVSRDDQARDMEWCIDRWVKGIEGAKALQSTLRFNSAAQAYVALCAAWPGEKRIKELREYIVH